MIPKQTKEALEKYEYHGVPPGSFLRAVLENNLISAFSQADDENTECLGEIVQWLWQRMPCNLWGSKEAVNSWIEKNTPGSK